MSLRCAMEMAKILLLLKNRPNTSTRTKLSRTSSNVSSKPSYRNSGVKLKPNKRSNSSFKSSEGSKKINLSYNLSVSNQARIRSKNKSILAKRTSSNNCMSRNRRNAFSALKKQDKFKK